MGPQGGWRYRGEGCACSAYGDAEDHPGRVLLVSKKWDLVEGRGALSDEEAEAARRLDAEIWTRTERPERFSAEEVGGEAASTSKVPLRLSGASH